MKLTKKAVDGLTPDPVRDVFVWDSELRGFGVRLKPSAAGAWIIQYRTPDGCTRRLALGKLGTLTPDEARKLARDKLAAVSSGADPSADRHAARQAQTVANLCDVYLEAAKAGRVMTRFRKPKQASTVLIDVGRVSRHIKPLIGQLRTDQLTRAAVQRMADDIAAGKTATIEHTKARGKAVVTGGAGTAARVVELLGGIWSWAEKRGHVSGANPAHGIETSRGTPRDRVLSPAELKALGQTLREMAGASPAAVAALRLIALTGCRLEEITSLGWAAIDEANSCLRLEKTKTGRSVRPIGRTALAEIAKLPNNNHDFVFPSRDGSSSADLTKGIAALFDAAGLKDARSHDLRRTFASTAAGLEYSDATIGELLGHARRGVTARHYIRRPDQALIDAAERVAKSIKAMMEGTSADVSTLRCHPLK